MSAKRSDRSQKNQRSNSGAYDDDPYIDPSDLEPVEIRPRARRGAVVSVRLTSEEAQKLARTAERSGLSLSELARRMLTKSVGTSWRVMVYGPTVAPNAVLVGGPPTTGGGYGSQDVVVGEAAP